MNISNYFIDQNFINQMPGLFIVHDIESKFLIGNQTAIQWTGFQSNEEMLGKTYYQMPCKAAEHHEEFLKQDNLILQNDGNGKIVGLYCYANYNWRYILAEKYPLKNESGAIIALCSYITDITHANIIDISRFLHLVEEEKPRKLLKSQSGYLVQNYHPYLNLTKKQSECLFFLIRGKTAKEISLILSISKRTIEHHINIIKTKLECKTKPQMIEKAISLGYMNFIPDSLLS